MGKTTKDVNTHSFAYNVDLDGTVQNHVADQAPRSQDSGLLYNRALIAM